eukprot:5028856-Alexandrium_andersonii.AAC.1
MLTRSLTASAVVQGMRVAATMQRPAACAVSRLRAQGWLRNGALALRKRRTAANRMGPFTCQRKLEIAQWFSPL